MHARISMMLPGLRSPAEARPGNADALRVDLVLPLLEAPADLLQSHWSPRRRHVVVVPTRSRRSSCRHSCSPRASRTAAASCGQHHHNHHATAPTQRCCSARLASKFDLACARSCASPSSSGTTHSSLHSSILHAPVGHPSSCSSTSPVLGRSRRMYGALTIRPCASPPTFSGHAVPQLLDIARVQVLLVLTQVVLIDPIRVLHVLTDDVLVGKVPLARIDILLDVRVHLALLVVLAVFVVALPTYRSRPPHDVASQLPSCPADRAVQHGTPEHLREVRLNLLDVQGLLQGLDVLLGNCVRLALMFTIRHLRLGLSALPAWRCHDSSQALLTHCLLRPPLASPRAPCASARHLFRTHVKHFIAASHCSSPSGSARPPVSRTRSAHQPRTWNQPPRRLVAGRSRPALSSVVCSHCARSALRLPTCPKSRLRSLLTASL
mmetsp:Transcript_21145/g.54909  ORF Transcript_21145/g.54909 Transcript_21145/m.54909 type:complete len:437 (-) Transcript_21145:32-1342(-)